MKKYEIIEEYWEEFLHYCYEEQTKILFKHPDAKIDRPEPNDLFFWDWYMNNHLDAHSEIDQIIKEASRSNNS